MHTEQCYSESSSTTGNAGADDGMENVTLESSLQIVLFCEINPLRYASETGAKFMPRLQLIINNFI